MNKDTPSNRKITFNGKSNLIKQQIHRLITVEEFLKSIEKDPDSIFEDFDVKYAIEKLQEWWLSDNTELKDNAERILKYARLTAYVPKDARGNLAKYRKHPGRLFREVKAIADELKKPTTLPKRGRKRSEKIAAIGQMLGRQISKDTLEKEVKGRVVLDCRNMAIYITAKKNYVSFYRMYKFYYEILPEKISDKKVVNFRMPICENIKLLEDTEAPFYNYNRAYEKYVMNKHILTEDIKKTLKQLALNLQPSLNKTTSVLAELGKSLQKSFQPLRQTLSNVNLTQLKPKN